MTDLDHLGSILKSIEGTDSLRFGNETIDLRGIEQIADSSQVRAAGLALFMAARAFMGKGKSLPEILDQLEELFEKETVDGLSRFGAGKHPGNLARPRRYEIAAALNRLRTLKIYP